MWKNVQEELNMTVFLYYGWLELDFILNFPWLIFLVGVFFPITAICLVF